MKTNTVDIQIYVEGLTNHKGDWFTIETPEDVDNAIQAVLDMGNEEYEIVDFDTNIRGLASAVGSWGTSTLKDLLEQLSELNSYEVDQVIALIDDFGIEEAIDTVKDGCVYCFTAETEADAVYEYLDETGYFEGVPEKFKDYF